MTDWVSECDHVCTPLLTHPPNFFTPKRFPAESRPFLVVPPAHKRDQINHSLTHSHTHSLTHSHTHTLTHSHTHTHTHTYYTYAKYVPAFFDALRTDCKRNADPVKYTHTHYTHTHSHTHRDTHITHTHTHSHTHPITHTHTLTHTHTHTN
jgi:hypothetical protein